MSNDLDLHFAAPPPDAQESAAPGDGVRYLLEQARFLADLPERINFKFRVRTLLREGRHAEAILAALAFDARTLELRRSGQGQPGGVPGAVTSAAPDERATRGRDQDALTPLDPPGSGWR